MQIGVQVAAGAERAVEKVRCVRGALWTAVAAAGSRYLPASGELSIIFSNRTHRGRFRRGSVDGNEVLWRNYKSRIGNGNIISFSSS